MKIAKIVRRHYTGVANCYGYPIWILRVVICEDNQVGYLNEKGVICIYESPPFTYIGKRPYTKYQSYLRQATKIAENAQKKISLNFDYDTPDKIFNDYLEENELLAESP